MLSAWGPNLVCFPDITLMRITIAFELKGCEFCEWGFFVGGLVGCFVLVE